MRQKHSLNLAFTIDYSTMREKRNLKPEMSVRKKKKNLKNMGVTLNNKISSSLNLRGQKKYVISKYDLEPGAHLCVKRTEPLLYTHHGLYLGFGLVIHYDFEKICIVRLEEFSNKKALYTVESKRTYDIATAIARATSRLGEQEYNLITNNCEHFVLWCLGVN